MPSKNLPPFMANKIKGKTTRARSGGQEKAIKEDFSFDSSQLEINSGATFSKNDVSGDNWSIEAKITNKKSFRLDRDYFRDVSKKVSFDQNPAIVVEFEEDQKSNLKLAVVDYDLFLQMAKLYSKYVQK